MEPSPRCALVPSALPPIIEHVFVEEAGRAPGADATVESRPEEARAGSEPVRGLPTEAIEREVAELSAHIAAATCRWLVLVAELDRRAAHEDFGFPSLAAWLSWRCALNPRSAREHLRVARCLAELPSVREAFSRGELSYSKVRALCRVATPERESELLYLARHATAGQLERIVRAYRGALSAQERMRPTSANSSPTPGRTTARSAFAGASTPSRARSSSRCSMRRGRRWLRPSRIRRTRAVLQNRRPHPGSHAERTVPRNRPGRGGRPAR